MSALIKLVLFSGVVVLSVLSVAAAAEPLQGFAEQSNTPTRIQRPADSAPSPNSDIQGNANQDQILQPPPLVKMEEFSRQTQSMQLPPNNQQFMAGASGGQDEYWVSWDVWRHRIADAVWGPLEKQRTIMWGMTSVDYDVTRDRHIQITSVYTPDPTGNSARILATAILHLEGSSLLAFPAGSKQTIHHNRNLDIGLPMPNRVHHIIHLPGGTEHVVNQW